MEGKPEQRCWELKGPWSSRLGTIPSRGSRGPSHGSTKERRESSQSACTLHISSHLVCMTTVCSKYDVALSGQTKAPKGWLACPRPHRFQTKAASFAEPTLVTPFYTSTRWVLGTHQLLPLLLTTRCFETPPASRWRSHLKETPTCLLKFP